MPRCPRRLEGLGPGDRWLLTLSQLVQLLLKQTNLILLLDCVPYLLVRDLDGRLNGYEKVSALLSGFHGLPGCRFGSLRLLFGQGAAFRR